MLQLFETLGIFERKRQVAVAIVVDSQWRFLVDYNDKWRGLAFPMTNPREGDANLEEAAVRAIEDDLGRRVSPLSIKKVGHFLRKRMSGSANRTTTYGYHVFEVQLRPEVLQTIANDPSSHGVFLSYEGLLTADNVTPTTKELAGDLVASQDVAIALIPRTSSGETYFLLKYNVNYEGYFFPATRMKGDLPAEKWAEAAVRQDTGFLGDVKAAPIKMEDEVVIQKGWRYGQQRTYRFQLCRAILDERDLDATLQVNGRKCVWVSECDLRQPDKSRYPLSRTVEPLVGWAVQATAF